MATAEPDSVSRDSDNNYINALTWGDKWSGTVTYNLVSSEDVTDGDGDSLGTSEAWTDYEVGQMQAALQTWSDVANITFSQQQDSSANLNIYKLTQAQTTAFLGPSTVGFQTGPTGESGQGLGAYNSGHFVWTDAGLLAGGEAYSTIIHEFGHGIGLSHPHDNGGGSTLFAGVEEWSDIGTNGQNQAVYTIMSYNPGLQSDNNTSIDYGTAATPMAFDIATVQKIYGANTTFNNGDNEYLLPTSNQSGTFYSCIWDTGGTDVMNYTGSDAVYMDLRAAPLTGTDAGGYISTPDGVFGGFTIANGVTIENAAAGSGNDTIVGNDVANALAAEEGTDLITGFGGNDIIYGNAGGDGVFGNTGSDTVFGGADDDTVYGGQDGDVLYGNNGNDHLFGNLGDDVLYGGAGGDLFYFQAGTGSDQVADFNAAEGDTLNFVGVSVASSADDGAGNAVVTLSDGGTVTVLNATASDLLFNII